MFGGEFCVCCTLLSCHSSVVSFPLIFVANSFEYTFLDVIHLVSEVFCQIIEKTVGSSHR